MHSITKEKHKNNNNRQRNIAINNFLIDTNIYGLAMKGDTETVSVLQRTTIIGICTVSIGELLAGFKGGVRKQKNRDELYEFLDSQRVMIYSINESTADIHAEIHTQLKKRQTDTYK